MILAAGGAACGGGSAPASCSAFYAYSADFQGFESWQSETYVNPTAEGLTHVAGVRTVYLNHAPPPGATEFPLGTIIVKRTEADGKIFARAKRGCGFNAQGAKGWEWFELMMTAPHVFSIRWGAAFPPAGETYGGDPNGGCNMCHNVPANDYVLAPGLSLAGFAADAGTGVDASIEAGRTAPRSSRPGPTRALKPTRAAMLAQMRESTMLNMSEVGSRVRSRVFGAAVYVYIGASALIPGLAHANPRPLPFTYQSETLPKGALEVEQFVDFVPSKVADPSGNPVHFLATEFQTEFELGLTDRLELGLYVSFVPQPSEYTQLPVMEFGNGAKQRVRYRLADPEAWPVDVALYGEVSENEREVELEGKIILQRRVGRVRFITNLWAEHEFYLDHHREWVLDPTVGVTAELSPRYHLGAEGWMRAEYRVGGGTSLSPHVYIGPAFMMNFGRLWWSNGVYVRVTDFDRAIGLGEAYGPWWWRTIIGLSF